MKVAVIETITEKSIAQFKKDRIDTIIFAKIDKQVNYNDLSQNYKLVDAFQNATESNWYNYKLISQQLSGLRKEFSKIFTFKGYDLEEALKKDFFWALLAPLALKYQKDTIGNSQATFKHYNKRSLFRNRIALVRRLFFYHPKIYKLEIPPDTKLCGSIAFRMNSVDVLPVYGNLFKKLDPKTLITFQSKPSKSAETVHQRLSSFFGQNITCISEKYHYLNLSFITRLKLLFSKNDPDFLNSFITIQNHLCNHIIDYEKLFGIGIKKIILNAGENEGEGNIVCSVAARNGGTVYNYMNGAKARDPQNVKTDFNFWFMPDEDTQQLILSYCDIKETELPVTGHLLYEMAQQHIYTGSLDKWITGTNKKKIISLFTSKIFVKETIEVSDFLHSYLNQNPNLLVFIRSHPGEPRTIDSHHERMIILPVPKQEAVQSTLFDLLQKSDAVISFSSTISYQATWFDKPSLNYELAEKSRLSYVDNKTVFQVSTTRQLECLLDRFLIKEEKIVGRALPGNASSMIADYIMNH